MYDIGIDLGSRTSKIVVLNKQSLVYNKINDTGVNPKETSKKLLQSALKDLKIDKNQINHIYTTGYGRNIVPFSDKRISEISCHAKGVNHLIPEVRTIIDIGGQDSKVILVNKSGRVLDFAMNDKCAAGTGKFLEVTATTLETTVDKLGELSNKSTRVVKVNSTCVVFAESEIIGLIADGKNKTDIIKAIHHSIAKRTKNLLAQLHWQSPVIFTGGVARNEGMVKAISEILDIEIFTPSNSVITGALGAALFAREG